LSVRLRSPFAVFFPLAALDAILAGAAWVGALAGDERLTASAVGEWHRRELLFGFLAAAMAGFLLTALPRWTSRDMPRWIASGLALLWLASRFAPAAPAPSAILAALPAVALALVCAFHVAAARDRRNLMTAALVALYAGAGAVACGPFSAPARDAAVRTAIAAALALIALIAGRILPALTDRLDLLHGAPTRARGGFAEIGAGLSCAIGLAAFLADGRGAFAATALMAAALGQIWRMTTWFGPRAAASPPLLGLYAAYAFLPAGFALLAAHALAPFAVPGGAGLHAWTVGGVGGMVLGVMASMVRKRSGLSFTTSLAGVATTLAWAMAASLRVGAEFVTAPALWLFLSALFWMAAFTLFLWDFRAPLFRR